MTVEHARAAVKNDLQPPMGRSAEFWQQVCEVLSNALDYHMAYGQGAQEQIDRLVIEAKTWRTAALLKHSDRTEIHLGRLAGESNEFLARRFGVPAEYVAAMNYLDV